MPDFALPATNGSDVPLRRDGVTVFYIYPKSGRPGVDPPPGWNDMPGMRGCTPQSCAFRDHFTDLVAVGVNAVFGVSTQTSDDQYEFGARLHLPYPLLSDVDCLLERELGIPAVDVTDELRVYRRVTVITRDGVIEKVFYPVFPPDEAPEQVMTYLRDTLVS